MTRWYLDACALINLYASEHLESVATMHGSGFLVVPNVLGEATWVYATSAGQRGERITIPLDTLVQEKVLEIVTPTPAMRDEFIRLARDLDDGEAMTLAAAMQTEDSGVITDDEAALTYLRRWPALSHTTSLSLLRQVTEPLPADACRQAIANLRIGARYVPGPRHPEYEWWERVTKAVLAPLAVE